MGVYVFVCACALWSESFPQFRGTWAHLFQSGSYNTESITQHKLLSELSIIIHGAPLWKNEVLQTSCDKHSENSLYLRVSTDASFIIDCMCYM